MGVAALAVAACRWARQPAKERREHVRILGPGGGAPNRTSPRPSRGVRGGALVP
jgi:hypothetical protein